MYKPIHLYHIKEIFYSIQGEGYHAGKPAVFCRFSGCNLWSGREEDRSKAICDFCDTEFVGIDGTLGGKYNAQTLTSAILSLWPNPTHSRPYVVLTGGEPMLQVDQLLLDELHASGIYVSIETNGTLPVLPSIDWITLSPKSKAKWVQKEGDELKLVYPQMDMEPEFYYKNSKCDHFILQPMDGYNYTENLRKTLEYCLSHPHWKIGLQLHKILQLP